MHPRRFKACFLILKKDCANCIILISVQRLGESVDLNNSTLISHSEWLIIEEMIAMQSNCKLEGLLGDML